MFKLISCLILVSIFFSSYALSENKLSISNSVIYEEVHNDKALAKEYGVQFPSEGMSMDDLIKTYEKEGISLLFKCENRLVFAKPSNKVVGIDQIMVNFSFEKPYLFIPTMNLSFDIISRKISNLNKSTDIKFENEARTCKKNTLN